MLAPKQALVVMRMPKLPLKELMLRLVLEQNWQLEHLVKLVTLLMGQLVQQLMQRLLVALS